MRPKHRYFVRRTVAAIALVCSLGSCGETPTAPKYRTPAALVILAGDLQTGQVGSELASPLVVLVVDAEERPIQSQLVNFRVTAGGGSVFAGAALTNADGIVRERWTLGLVARDTQRVEARAVDPVSGEAIVFARFAATGTPAGAAALVRLSPDSVHAVAGTAVASPPRVRVTDLHGNVVPGVTVTFSVGAGSGVLIGATPVTNDSGIAAVDGWTLGSVVGVNQVRATVPSVPDTVIFVAFGSTGPPASMMVAAGNGQSVTAGAPVPVRPAVRVIDVGGNPVPGVPVTFGVQSGGGSLLGAAAVTDTAGVAVVGEWRVGAIAGVNTLLALAAPLPEGPVAFTAMGTAPPVTQVLVRPDSSANVDAVLATLPVIAVEDSAGRRLPGVSVQFIVRRGAAVLSGDSTTTNANGEATLGSWTMGPVPTVNEVEVRVSGAPAATLQVEGSWARRLELGETTSCALAFGGEVYCWGDNSSFYWEYGEDPAVRPASTVPVAVTGPVLAQLSAGAAQHMCGIDPVGAAFCWGRAGAHRGNGGTYSMTATNSVLGGIEWAEIAVGRLVSCGSSRAGLAYCFGMDQKGEVTGTTALATTSTAVPYLVANGRELTRIVAGWAHSCGLDSGGNAWCWGDNRAGQLGIGAVDGARHGVTAVTGGHHFFMLTAGSLQTCGVTVDGVAMCWGMNNTGQLGDGTTALRIVPTAVATELRFGWIATSSGFGAGTGTSVPSVTMGNLTMPSAAHTCALTDDGQAYCWGWNSGGQVGDGTTTDRLMPVAVAGNERFTALALGGSATCGIRRTAVWCWGGNVSGQLGNGSIANSPLPVRVQPPF